MPTSPPDRTTADPAAGTAGPSPAGPSPAPWPPVAPTPAAEGGARPPDTGPAGSPPPGWVIPPSPPPTPEAGAPGVGAGEEPGPRPPDQDLPARWGPAASPPPPPSPGPGSSGSSGGGGAGSPRRSGRIALVAALVVSWLAAGVLGGVIGNRLDDGGTTAAASAADTRPARDTTTFGQSPDLAEILARVEPAVVAVRSTAPTVQGDGTGVVISDGGEVLTNAHVVEGASEIFVTLPRENEARTARLVGADTDADIALLTIDGASGLPVVEIGDSSDVQVGDAVVAVGNALGFRGAPSVTSGIVSALDRSLGTLTGLIQTDAAINPGNSGGPLVNAAGQVIGINTAIRGNAQNIGFAIPSNRALSVVDRLRSGQPPEPVAFVGVTTRNPLDGSPGAEVVEVTPGTAAEAAGVEVGDRVISFDGDMVVGSAEFGGLVRRHVPGDRVSMEVVRGNRTVTLDLELGTRPSA